MNELLTPLVRKYIGSLVRAGLQAAGGWLVGQGVVTDAEWSQILPGLITLGVGLLWSLWEKRDSLRQLFTIAAMPKGTTLNEANATIAVGVRASAGTGAGETPTLKPRKD